MSKQCAECGKKDVEYYARDSRCKECRKEYIRIFRRKKEKDELEQKSLDNSLEDISDILNMIYISQQDIQIKQQDLEIKLDNLEEKNSSSDIRKI
jgi:hypothetical protein